MALTTINYDSYLVRIRELFRNKYGRELEIALSAEGEKICDDAFFVRTVNYNNCMLPWIESVFCLKGASVLEIGCGGGAAGLAIAHKVGRIDAFDIEANWLKTARERVAFLGITNVNYGLLRPDWALPGNIEEFRRNVGKQFDVVLLPALLEHLTMDERLSVLETSWSMLRSGGIMVVYDTPNRLYAYDSHSFRLPFFNWLPDDLALRYASRSPRVDHPQALSQANDRMKTLYRLGRGVSYHEFDLMIGLTELEVIDDGYSRLLTHRAVNDVFEGALMQAFEKYAPHVPAGFSKQYLELVIRKKWHKIALVERNLVSDEMLYGTRPALLLQHESFLQYRVPEPGYGKLTVEVLKHPWSSVLLVCDSQGHIFHREELYSEYPVTKVLQISLPQKIRDVQLRVTSGKKSLGNQAWILGAGADI